MPHRRGAIKNDDEVRGLAASLSSEINA
jgi:hypothetical protein